MKRVFKFGGGVMKDAEGIRKVADIISDFTNNELVVVVSAFGKTTNALENLLKATLEKDDREIACSLNKIKESHFNIAQDLFSTHKHVVFDQLENLFHFLLKETEKNFDDKYKAYDQIVSYGELLSSLIVHHYLLERQMNSHLIDARTIIQTNSNYTDAAIDWNTTGKNVNDRLGQILKNSEIVLTQGFIGADEQTNSTTLGREGSDFTASIIANLLDANEVTIWKDVPGLMNADPKKFEKTEKLDHISYQEAIELVYYGASVIHPKTIQPLQSKNIPLFIRSFYNPEIPPSVISSETSMDDKVPKIIVKENQVLLSISKPDATFVNKDNMIVILRILAENKIHINLIQHSASRFIICIDENPYKIAALQTSLTNLFLVKQEPGLTLLTIRHYNGELIKELTTAKKIIIEQKGPSTIQLLLASN